MAEGLSPLKNFSDLQHTLYYRLVLENTLVSARRSCAC